MDQDPPLEEGTQSLEFQAEVQQLLHILAHSLYTEQDIFLRELVSNASDALNRIQFEMLTNREVLQPEAELKIDIDFDEEAKTLTVSDTGIGLTKAELIENLGTIAHSGAMAFLKNLEDSQRPGDIIGQFGVGFYSVFMVAEEVRVTSRSYSPDEPAWTWTSRGKNTYTLAPAEKEDRGTAIEIQLQEDAAEFASAWRLEQIIKKHSDFIAFPIYIKDKVVNQQTALWRKSPQEIEEGEYNEFYRQLTLDFDEPLLHIHMVADVPVDIRSVLYIPRKRERMALRFRTDHGLKLYMKNVLIQEYNKDLLPHYFRFVEGVVDSEDLPLNISRETVQSDRALRRIRKALAGRLTRALDELWEEKPDEYTAFWEELGGFIKEGVATDPTSRDDLVPLLRFHSTHSDDALISLEDYMARMGEDQETIYYVLGEDLVTVTSSPHLDYFKAHDLEVLYLTDPLDGFMIQSLREFKDKKLQNVDDAGLELPASEEEKAEPEIIAQADFDQLVDRFKKVLGEKVVDVRASTLLTDSPSRLVTPKDAPDRDLQRLRRIVEEDYQIPAKILEVNRRHPIIQNLSNLVVTQTPDDRIDAVIEQLFENLLLLEGIHPNPAQMIPRIQSLLEAATQDQ